MLTFLLRRLLHAMAIVALAASASFALVRWAPGDAAVGSVGESGLSAAALADRRAKLDLDSPLPVQLGNHLATIARGDLGVSSSEQRPVVAVLADALPATLMLSGAALVIAIVLGVLVGTFQGWRPRNRFASTLGGLLTAAYAIPEVVLGIGLLAVFAMQFPMFPVGGMTDPLVELTGSFSQRVTDRLWHLILPACALALGWSAAIVRHQRAAMRDIAADHHIRTATAKGVHSTDVLRRHAVRPALPGTIALIGTLLPTLVGGTVIVESLFAWPGMGSLIVRSVGMRDAPLVVGAVVLIASVIALGAIATDLLARALDPRLRERAA